MLFSWPLSLCVPLQRCGWCQEVSSRSPRAEMPWGCLWTDAEVSGGLHAAKHPGRPTEPLRLMLIGLLWIHCQRSFDVIRPAYMVLLVMLHDPQIGVSLRVIFLFLFFICLFFFNTFSKIERNFPHTFLYPSIKSQEHLIFFASTPGAVVVGRASCDVDHECLTN